MRRLLLPLLAVLIAGACLPATASARRGACLPQAGDAQCYVWSGKVTFVADADTVYVDVAGDGTAARSRVRITGLQAMEQTIYTSRAARRRGECHAVEATARLEQLLRAGKWRVRLAAQDPASRSGSRLRRSVAVRIGGRWRDVGRTLIAEGHALWLPNGREHVWNRDYGILAERAARARLNLWDPDYCGYGPSEGATLGMWVNWDADGDDSLDPNGEWVRIKNFDPVNPMPLAGWWLRDSALRRFTFPAWASIPPGGDIMVFVGEGESYDTEFYWNLRKAIFENVRRDERHIGDGAYLFDPEGDLRLSMTYPCREGCTDPNQGAIQLAAQPSRRESVQLTNVSAVPVDLEGYRLSSPPYGFAFRGDSVLPPGETMTVRLWESYDDDRPFVKYWPTNGPILNNAGDKVELRTFTDILLACTAWGSRSC